MKRQLLAIAGLVALFSGQAIAQTAVSGVVFFDSNRNGVRDAGEVGLPGIHISNGRDIVTTDSHGGYKVPGGTNFVFVIKPAGWMTSEDSNHLPRFYAARPIRADFGLYRHKEPERFKAIIFADTQADKPEHVNYLAHDVIEELIGTDAAFGTTLGDIVFNKVNLYDPLIKTVGKVGIPWYNVKGNHDFPAEDGSPVTFESTFGPNYYSFNFGLVHFLVLDSNSPVTATSTQLAFVKNDLTLVPKDQLVVLLMHFPMIDIDNRQDLYRLLENRPHTLSLSGHLHEHQEFFLGAEDGWNGKTPHHNIANGAAGGIWYTGMPDEVGIPSAMMWDGTPNGYSIISFDRNTYSVKYKVARKPIDYQMNIFAPETIGSVDSSKAQVMVDIFAGSIKSKVGMRVDNGAWTIMALTKQEDPYYVQDVNLESKLENAPWDKLYDPHVCTHLWGANLPANLTSGVHVIEIRTTDEYGQTFESKRLIRVE